MQTRKTETLIVGAGPAGLATAIELAKAGKDFILVERSSRVGGLSKTYEFKEGDLIFRTDNGPHRFFSKNPYLYEFIGGILGEDWIQVKRQTRQYIDGKFYDYPVNAGQAFRNIGPSRATKMVLDYVYAKFKYGLFKKPINNFADYVYANFGKTLGEFNMINYTEKIWGIPAQDIHIDWASQRIKGLSLVSLARDMIKKIFRSSSKNEVKSLVDTFYYPKYGTGEIYESVKKKIERSGYQILLNTYPTSVQHDGKNIKKLVCQSPEGEIEIEFKNLVESVHIKDFLSLLEPKIKENIKSAQNKMQYRSQVYLFITLNKASITPDQWIYFPGKENPIGRISEMRNFSSEMSPVGKTSIFVEFFCSKGDDTWNMNAEELFNMAMKEFERMQFFRKSEVRKYYRLAEENVYPIYDVSYKEYLAEAKNFLDKFENLYYIGRPGRFRYNNQDHSLEMGILAAKSIIDNKKYDLDSVGAETEYYEKGNLNNQNV